MYTTDKLHIISEIKDRLQLSTVVSVDTKLLRRGTDQYVGSCPLHNEKTASFFVNDNIGSYFCFGCREHGDVIQYVMTKRSVNFIQALHILAEMAGISIENIETDSKKQKYLKIMQIVADYYHTQLNDNNEILSYCKQRDINNTSIRQFYLGYSGNFNKLCETIKNNGYSDKDIREIGIEKFKNRIIFPICNKSGNVVAFGGRTLDNNIMPKYINSYDSDLFHKQTILYGYNIAARNVNKNNGFIVVEGYIDVIAMHQYGFNTTIASMGTSFSVKHLQQIWQYCNQCVLCFDGDAAGQKASIRAALLCLEHVKAGKEVRICNLPSHEDPASYLYKYGKEKMSHIIEQSTYLIDYIWKDYVDRYNKIAVKTPEAVSEWKNDIFQTIDRISDKSVQLLYKVEYRERIYKLLHPKYSISQNMNKVDICIDEENNRLIYECILLYTIKKFYHYSDVIVERLSEIEFVNGVTVDAKKLIVDGNIELVNFEQIEKVARRYHDFDNINESNIDVFISSVINQTYKHFSDESKIEENVKNSYLCCSNDDEWNRLRRLKKNKIKQ